MAEQPSLIIIPARMASSRFPGKPLVKINGVPMLERVWKIARAVKRPSKVIIATDSEEIIEFCETIGAETVLTSAACATGLDRAAEVIKKAFKEFEIVLTLQGDAVLTPPWIVENLIDAISEDAGIEVATPAIRLTDKKLAAYIKLKQGGSSTGTTVTFDYQMNALYFSKALIPHSRDYSKLKEIYRHIGLYAYRRETLLKLSELSQSKFELVENLEQLRALENGIKIKIVEVDYQGRTHSSVDNPEDVAATEEIIRQEGEMV